MALPIQVNPKDPCIDIHTGRGQGSCTFANGFNCVCSCAGIAHAQLLRMVLTPENSKKLPDKYKQALANKVQTVQARIADIPHDKVTTIIHAQKQPKRVFFLCEDVSHPMVVPEFLRTLVFARPRGDDQFADCTFSPSLDMSR